jgi:hypothetical protein
MYKYSKYWFGCVLLMAGAAGFNKTQAQQKRSIAATIDSIINIKPVEAVNIGYISPRKTNITGAVSVVDENRIKEFASVSIDALLQGQAAGVRVANISSAPGSGALVNMRGVNILLMAFL